MAPKRRIKISARPRETRPSCSGTISGYGSLRVGPVTHPSRAVERRPATNAHGGFTLGSAYVAYGDEHMEDKTQPAAAYSGKKYISRMITAQFDSIGYKHVLVRLKRDVIDELWLLMQKRTNTTFFTVYLIVFMMLHEVSVACQDRRRRAKEQGLSVQDSFFPRCSFYLPLLTSWPAHEQTYYDLEEATAKIKHGADIILGHWHYYKGDLDPLTMTEASLVRAFGEDCIEEIRLLMATCQRYEHMSKYLERQNRTTTIN